MAFETVEKTIKIVRVRCDFCSNSTKDIEIHGCVMCGGQMCNDHAGDVCEDGLMCIECAKKFEFVDGHDTKTVDKKTGKEVSWGRSENCGQCWSRESER